MTLIGREQELKLIEEAIAQHTGQQPHVIFVLGEAGSGRTSLLEYAKSKSTKNISLNRPKIEDGPSHYFEETLHFNLFKQISEAKVELAQLNLSLPDLNATDPFEPRLRAVQAIPPEALHYLIRRLYTLYDISKLSSDAAMFIKTGLEHILQLNANNLGQLRTFVGEIVLPSLTEEEWQFYLRPDESLAKMRGEILANHSADPTFGDDYRSFSGENLLPILIELSRNLWFFAAETLPGWADKLTCPVDTIQLSPLNNANISTYFEQKYGRSLSPKELEWLEKLSGGNPLRLGLISDLYHKGIPAATLDAAATRTPADPLEGLLLFFVEESGLLNVEQKAMLCTMGLLLNTNRDFIQAFGEKVKEAGYPFSREVFDTLNQEFAWLWEPAVEPGDWAALHPAIKARLQKWLLIERNRFSMPVQEGIIEPARNAAAALLKTSEQFLIEMAPEKGSLQERVENSEWCRAVINVAYYRWWLDEAVGWLFALPRAVMGLAYSPSFAQEMLDVAESISGTFQVEGQEIMPCLRVLLQDNYTLAAPKAIFDEKLKALETLESLTTTDRGRWFKQENLGLRQGGKGSGEAEMRGILRWLQGKVYEQSAQYDRAAGLYESTLATNVEMPELKRAASRAGLYLAIRYRLKGSNEAALSALLRTVELNPELPEAHRLLLWQGIRMNRPDVILKAAQALVNLKDTDPHLEIYAVLALWLQGRQAESLSAAKNYAATHSDGKQVLLRLVEVMKIEGEKAGLEEILTNL